MAIMIDSLSLHPSHSLDVIFDAISKKVVLAKGLIWNCVRGESAEFGGKWFSVIV